MRQTLNGHLFAISIFIIVNCCIETTAFAELTMHEGRNEKGELVYTFFKDKKEIAKGVCHHKEDEIVVSSGSVEDGEYLSTVDSSKNTKSIPFVDGKVHGIVKVYYSTGEVWRSIPYKEGKKHGTMRILHERGWLITEREYVHGVQHGISRQFYESGKVKRVATFDQGKMVSMKQYDEEGKLERER